MAPQVIRLPDGQTFTVTPVFAGLGFKSHELNTHHNAFPVGWTVVLNTESDADSDESETTTNGNRHGTEDGSGAGLSGGGAGALAHAKRHVHSFSKPTLQGDNLFISSIANPSSSEFKPAASPTRQIAMMLWITLYWYFHQASPDPQVPAAAAKATPVGAKPRGEWRINVRREGVLRGRNLLPKLERMGLLASASTAVGTCLDDDGGDAWDHMFVTRRMFWQLPGRLFLFSLQPQPSKDLPAILPGSPPGSRPGSPTDARSPIQESDVPGAPAPMSMVTVPSYPAAGPFYSSSHLPTYYPPAPLQYTFTNNIRHPLRPKPPRMGEVFYTRFVPSVGQYLSFRVASAAPAPVPYYGPVGCKSPERSPLTSLSDSDLLALWLGKPRVKEFWGDYSPDFLPNVLKLPHSFPVIGMWDGVPFGYFEIYWVKEDILGQHLGGEATEWDRGLHVLIGEEWARGRVPIWLSGLVHWCLTSDYRTMNICLEPRIDNARFLQRLENCGFSREKQIAFPHKQSWYVRLRREQWEGPAL